MKTILVTGIGGVVGQGILRNLRKLDQEFRIVGSNISPISGGNHLCDAVVQVPYAYEKNYIPAMQRACDQYSVDIVIPSTDYEAYYLSEHHREFNCLLATSPVEATRMCLDKYENASQFESKGIRFAESMLPSGYDGRFPSLIVKPREGRGSRDIHVNPSNVKGFSDEYLVQEYLEGPEITTTFYVTTYGKLLGKISFMRELEAGNTLKAQVTKLYDQELDALINQIVGHFTFRGSVNIQSRITSKGLVPFEMNCRISGTNSIRSQFGFNDVEFTIRDFLLKEELPTPRVSEGSAIRIMLDVVYPELKLDDIRNRKDTFYIY